MLVVRCENEKSWRMKRPGIFATSYLSILIRMVHPPVRVESLQEHEHERSEYQYEEERIQNSV